VTMRDMHLPANILQGHALWDIWIGQSSANSNTVAVPFLKELTCLFSNGISNGNGVGCKIVGLQYI
jgi:hypothetical protein